MIVYAEKIAIAVKEKRAVTIFDEERKIQPVVRFTVATVRDRYSVVDSPVYGVDGQKLEKDKVLARLKVGQVVLLSSDGKMIDWPYLQAVGKDTLVLVPKATLPLRKEELERP